MPSMLNSEIPTPHRYDFKTLKTSWKNIWSWTYFLDSLMCKFALIFYGKMPPCRHSGMASSENWRTTIWLCSLKKLTRLFAVPSRSQTASATSLKQRPPPKNAMRRWLPSEQLWRNPGLQTNPSACKAFRETSSAHTLDAKWWPQIQNPNGRHNALHDAPRILVSTPGQPGAGAHRVYPKTLSENATLETREDQDLPQETIGTTS